MTPPNKFDHPRQCTGSVQAEYVRIRRTLRLVVGSRESALQAGKYAPSAWARTSVCKADSMSRFELQCSVYGRRYQQLSNGNNAAIRVSITCDYIKPSGTGRFKLTWMKIEPIGVVYMEVSANISDRVSERLPGGSSHAPCDELGKLGS